MLLLFARLQAPVREVTLARPDQVIAEPFSQVRGIRELGNPPRRPAPGGARGGKGLPGGDR